MPFKSDAQRRKFADLVKQGVMAQAVFDEWEQGTPAHLPERIHPKAADRTRVVRRVTPKTGGTTRKGG